MLALHCWQCLSYIAVGIAETRIAIDNADPDVAVGIVDTGIAIGNADPNISVGIAKTALLWVMLIQILPLALLIRPLLYFTTNDITTMTCIAYCITVAIVAEIDVCCW